MSLVSAITAKYPRLKKDLQIARINKTPEQVIRDSLKMAFMMAGGFTVLSFFYISKQGGSMLLVPLIFLGMLYLMYNFSMLKIKSKILKRRKEIDRDVLFAGRYLLVKLNSGQPLVNALIDASKSYGVANNYFKEIVRDIELGKPVEKALNDASEYSPSDHFKKILFQISNALKIGIDVTEFLDATINEISNRQLIEINRFGKKLNSVTLFYMLFAVVLPSLGLTIFIVVASLSSVPINESFFGIVLFFLLLIQVIFLMTYRAISPNINI